MSIKPITELQNLTGGELSFEVRGGNDSCRFPKSLPPGKIKSVKLHWILKSCRYRSDGLKDKWKIKVTLYLDGKISVVEIMAWHLLQNTRIVFAVVDDDDGNYIFLIDGIPENNSSDWILRLNWRLGLKRMRNKVWSKRDSVKIKRSMLTRGSRDVNATAAAMELEQQSILTSIPTVRERGPSVIITTSSVPHEELPLEAKTLHREGYQNLITTPAVPHEGQPFTNLVSGQLDTEGYRNVIAATISSEQLQFMSSTHQLDNKRDSKFIVATVPPEESLVMLNEDIPQLQMRKDRYVLSTPVELEDPNVTNTRVSLNESCITSALETAEGYGRSTGTWYFLYLKNLPISYLDKTGRIN